MNRNDSNRVQSKIEAAGHSSRIRTCSSRKGFKDTGHLAQIDVEHRYLRRVSRVR